MAFWKDIFVYLFRHIYIIMNPGFAIITIMALITGSCSFIKPEKKGESVLTDTLAVPETYFTNLFIRNCCGFTGGDGTYSVLLPDGRTVWIFGDTFLGTVSPDMIRRRLSPMFIRNSFVIQDGDSLKTM